MIECVPKGVYIHKTLSDVQQLYKIRWPQSEMRGIKLLHNIAPVHDAK